MPNIIEVQTSLQKLTNRKITYTDIGNIIGTGRANISLRAKNNSQLTSKELNLLEAAYNVSLSGNKQIKHIENDDCIPLTYYPDVYLSAGYGVEIYDEGKETMLVDSRLLVSERGNKINPEHCEIVRVSGNSMSPEYRHGDRVIIDRGDTELLDGHIFAFRYNGSCFVKEINLLGDKIKCISLNKEYDPFYIKKGEQFTVLGRIIPRVRL